MDKEDVVRLCIKLVLVSTEYMHYVALCTTVCRTYMNARVRSDVKPMRPGNTRTAIMQGLGGVLWGKSVGRTSR
jgi:hypothetical protein